MKIIVRKHKWAVGFLSAAVVLLLFGLSFEKRPFAGMEAEDVVSAEMFVIPPEVTMPLEDATVITELVDTLKSLKVYGRNNSGRDYVGQLVRFTLTLRDGTVMSIGEYNPFIYINDICYKAEYGACQRLNALGNRLLHGQQVQ
ncbi:MAG: hypothetical protein ACERKO_05605 [Acetanaerobacterium sp.]